MIEQRDETGTLTTRYTYGNGIDEVVEVEKDSDNDGTLESYYPVLNNIDSVVGIVDSTGHLVEKMDYATYGTPIFVYDHTPPGVDVVRVKEGAILIRFSEPVKRDRAQQAIKIRMGAEELSGAITFEDEDRVAKFTPSVSLPQNEALTVSISTDLEDLAQNRLAQAFSQAFTYSGADLIAYDRSAPEVESIRLVSGGIYVEFSEEIDPTTTIGSVELSSAVGPTAGEISLSNERTVKFAPTSAITPGITYTIKVKTLIKDLSGQSLASEMAKAFNTSGADLIIYQKPDPNHQLGSYIGNTTLFQGREYDGETGLYYFRARYLHPELGRFLQPDPLGYVDSMNPYQTYGNNPGNFVDPMGDRVYNRREMEEMYWNAIHRSRRKFTFREFVDRFSRQNKYEVYVHGKKILYMYDPRDFDRGGDIITDSGRQYIHHDPSYTLIPVTHHRPQRRNIWQWIGLFSSQNQEYQDIHRFDYPYDPNNCLEHPLLYPGLKRATQKTIFKHHIEDRTHALRVFETYRSFAQSNAYAAAGTGVPGGYSWHNYAQAVDIVFQNASGGPSWDIQFNWAQLGQIGLSSGFTQWGGNFTRRDYAHFQIAFRDSCYDHPEIPGDPRSIVRDAYYRVGGGPFGIRFVQLLNMFYWSWR